MVYRFAIANVDAAAVAARGQSAGLAGSIAAGFGFGAWGIEPSVFLEFAAADVAAAARVFDFVHALLAEFGEAAAYFTRDGGAPALLWTDGRRVEELAAPAEV